MSVLIIYCHPYVKSFNHAILEHVQKNLQTSHLNYHTIDLYYDDFNPTYSAKELSLYHDGGTTDPLVSKYLSLLKKCQTVIFITPYWWNDIPGMLKGFIDKVMKEGVDQSHTVTKTGVKGALTNVKHCYVLTTSTSPTWYIRFFLGNAIKKIFINKTLKQLGFSNISWQNFGSVTNSSLAKRNKYLDKVARQTFK
ncbi:NAD(P)H-dependent oxidoreductase [Limosilactobacillus agrestis]|uniref:NAD(P)H-dependent oxidoreductase n=1 Tax=Limosilactobacillus agrestis TaxID=2759748 RepID=A0ABS8R639_9LACO|nr:NAD(P)H-dependent oxidoreductase [Limosilactobacillus agrestis]MCD7130239.1 NAD(P)H-dependent oxidoreductase [Limosilactobacillus agrestis]